MTTALRFGTTARVNCIIWHCNRHAWSIYPLALRRRSSKRSMGKKVTESNFVTRRKHSPFEKIIRLNWSCAGLIDCKRIVEKFNCRYAVPRLPARKQTELNFAECPRVNSIFCTFDSPILRDLVIKRKNGQTKVPDEPLIR